MVPPPVRRVIIQKLSVPVFIQRIGLCIVFRRRQVVQQIPVQVVGHCAGCDICQVFVPIGVELCNHDILKGSGGIVNELSPDPLDRLDSVLIIIREAVLICHDIRVHIIFPHQILNPVRYAYDVDVVGTAVQVFHQYQRPSSHDNDTDTLSIGEQKTGLFIQILKPGDQFITQYRNLLLNTNVIER